MPVSQCKICLMHGFNFPGRIVCANVSNLIVFPKFDAALQFANFLLHACTAFSRRCALSRYILIFYKV